MSNNREAALMQALKSIEKQYGKGSVMKLGEKTDTRIEVVSSGSLALDSVLEVILEDVLLKFMDQKVQGKQHLRYMPLQRYKKKVEQLRLLMQNMRWIQLMLKN